jgi:hypothetical protein
MEIGMSRRAEKGKRNKGMDEIGCGIKIRNSYS